MIQFIKRLIARFRRKPHYDLPGMNQFYDESVAALRGYLDDEVIPDALVIMDRHPELFGPDGPFHADYLRQIEKVRKDRSSTLH